MPRRESLTHRLSFILLAFAIVLVAASPTLANAGTPLMWASGLFMLFGNAGIGILEGLIIGRLFKVRIGRAIPIMIVANYVSMFAGVAGVEYLSNWFQDIRMRQDPLYAGWSALYVAAAVSFVCSIFLEWPFCLWAMRRAGTRPGHGLRASAMAQVASYTLIVPYFYSLSSLSLYNDASLQSDLRFVKPPIATVYYINPDDGDVWRIRTDGTGKQRALSADLSHSQARLFVDKDEKSERYDLWCVAGERGDVRVLSKGIGKIAAPRRLFEMSDEPGTFGNHGLWGRATDHTVLDPTAPSQWRAFPGFWAAQGLAVKRGDERDYTIAMDAPFVSWFCRNAVNLPNDQAIFQLDNMIVILDMPTRKLGFLTIGRGPVVALDDVPTSQPRVASLCDLSDRRLCCRDDAVDIFGRCAPVDDADAHGALGAPGGAAEEGFAAGVDGGDDGVGSGVVVGVGGAGARVEEAHEALIERGLPEHFDAGQIAEAFDDR